MTNKFNHLNVPDQWNHYWSRYPQGYTIMESLIAWVSQVDAMVDAYNLTVEEVQAISTRILTEIEVLRTETLPENIGNILNEWYENGTLGTIINDTLLNMKADRADLEQFQLDVDKRQDDFELATNNTLMELEERIDRITVNVQDFGAKGDGVTNDTGAIQAAINAVSGKKNATVLFPPTPGSHYLVNTLEIHDNSHILRFLGLGYAKICYTGQVGFRVMSEMFTVDNMIIWSINPTAESDGTMFLDARTYKRLDFDIHLKNSTFAYASKLVVAWGRGVNIEMCNMNNITHQIIKINYHPREQIEEGPYDIQKYKTGYRGWVLRNNRFHYCTAVAFDNTADIEHVATGFLMTGNQIEGALGYFAGYCRDGVFTDNLNYHTYSNRESLFRFTGVDNVTIDVNISGMSNEVHGYSKRFSRLAEFLGPVNNLRISGNIQNVMKHVFTFYENATNVLIDVNVQDFVPQTNWNVSYVFFGPGPKAYKNVRINGSVEMNSPGGDVAQKYDLLSTFTNVQVNTLASGQYRNLTNLTAK